MSNEYEDIFSISTEEPVEVLSVEPPKAKKGFDLKTDKVLLIQLVLLAAWAILTTLIYFFGYDLFSPFINV